MNDKPIRVDIHIQTGGDGEVTITHLQRTDSLCVRLTESRAETLARAVRDAEGWLTNNPGDRR